MGFSKMMELLQEKNRGEIVLCNNGGFYVATGKDAVFLNELLKLKVSCFKPEVCKIGFPIASLEKYTELIHEKGYGYIVYYFHKETAELEKILEYNGKNKNEITSSNINCYKCKHTTKYYKKNDIYVQAVAKLYEKEEQKNKEMKKKKEEKYKWFKIRKKKMWLIKQILFAQPRIKGLEIGNYTSQMFANIYLNEIDQYIKHELKIKYYCRYLDDSVLFVKTKKEAKQALEKIKIYLKENLELELNKKTQIFKNKQGVNFCGYKINEYRMKLRDKGKRKLKKKIKYLKYQIRNEKMTSKEAKRYLAGHLGYIKYANVNNLLEKIFYIEK